ncbi:hypothetical protein NUU61_002307 [Penicillium alfredii]|uniref:Uncharacterized protein n=1 Tax=Penicillium alfredii TaxID=1506179 RepID=A0A9W9FS14_9EURO|nr:uncharacterized protein NUU61_002307 [Penicillium alfredii]KAJ5104960.1 hypothetical protein NUU61_002307 [Penicillium alfredii]
MSDDEEYYDWEEEFLFEDVATDVADELAATAYSEAALYEHPTIDLEDYPSDWDYYSDDYYDDDPTAERSTTEESRVAAPTTACSLDLASFQGVVWKTPGLKKDQDTAIEIHEPDYGEKVALLKNWREIFKSAQPATDKSRLRSQPGNDSRHEGVSLSGEDTPGVPCVAGENPDHDDSDPMSDVVSLDAHPENANASECGQTSWEHIQSSTEPPSATAPLPAKRGRKRKADVSTEATSKDQPNKTSVRSRSRRAAAAKPGGERQSHASGPTRKSARQKK